MHSKRSRTDGALVTAAQGEAMERGTSEGTSTSTSSDRICDLVSKTPTGVLRPFRYFVAWNGVLTLAFSGFSHGQLLLKEAVQETIKGVCKENPGSRWPKVTLGAVKDGFRLTPEQFQELRKLCKEESECFTGEPCDVHIREAHMVTYECRSLERICMEAGFRFATDVPAEEASPQSAAYVAEVLEEAEAPDYWFMVSGDGNRESHYRSHAVGVTLAHMLGRSLHRQTELAPLRKALVRFKDKVEKAYPGLFAFFDESSLHVTLRALF